MADFIFDEFAKLPGKVFPVYGKGSGHGEAELTVNVAVSGGRRIGIGVAMLHVDRRHRGKGYAKAALLAFCRDADKLGLDAYLTVCPDDDTDEARLIEIYSSFGFVPCGRRMGHLDMIRRPDVRTAFSSKVKAGILAKATRASGKPLMRLKAA